MSSSLTKFQQKLGVLFKNTDLLKQALTHRSVSKNNNERLEFLGDSILGAIISIQLYAKYPTIDEGGLSRYRATLVCGAMLAKLAEQYGFSEVLILSEGERKSGSFRCQSILADTFEAVVGALFLDQGIDVVNNFLTRVYKQRLNNLPPVDSLKDPKTKLQELLQSKKIALPVYKIIKEKHENPQSFEVLATINELDIKQIAVGTSRQKAEQQAAEQILNLINMK